MHLPAPRNTKNGRSYLLPGQPEGSANRGNHQEGAEVSVGVRICLILLSWRLEDSSTSRKKCTNTCCKHPPLLHSHRIQLEYLQKETAAGRVPAWEPPAAPPARSLLHTVGIPAFTSRYQQDAELAMATSISKSMWTSNPGYVLRDGPSMTSSTHQAYAYDTEAVSASMRCWGSGVVLSCKERAFSRWWCGMNSASTYACFVM